jgi:short-subunit dehydrogenase
MPKGCVVITGASSGIGRALAIEFASRGFDLLLTGRNQAALDEVASLCREHHGIEADFIVADLSDGDSVRKLIATISELPVEVLANNAGFGVNGNFVDTSIEDEERLVEVQLSKMMSLTKAVLPGMIGRRRGVILNIASVYSLSPVPRQSVYGACKAFILSFSSALREELNGTGVTVTAVLPGTTQTEFRRRTGVKDKGNSGMTAAAVAKISVDAALSGKAMIVPGSVNKLFVFLSRHLPMSLVARGVRLINNRRGVNE